MFTSQSLISHNWSALRVLLSLPVLLHSIIFLSVCLAETACLSVLSGSSLEVTILSRGHSVTCKGQGYPVSEVGGRAARTPVL